MFIQEAGKRAKLTKKAIEYYTLQGLVTPSVLENGYRAYSQRDLEVLERISILRKLDLSIEEIRAALADSTNAALQAASARKALEHQRADWKRSILEALGAGGSYEEAGGALQAMEREKSITDKLLDAFPGYYGRFVCMHFSRFLREPIRSAGQRAAYETILSFLDAVPPLDLPEELEAYLTEGTSHIGTEQIAGILAATQNAYENPDAFLADNRETLEEYLAFKHAEGYRRSPACQLLELMRKFNHTSGYDTVFLPAMRRLSGSYAAYARRMELANEKLMAQYPAIGKGADTDEKSDGKRGGGALPRAGGEGGPGPAGHGGAGGVGGAGG